jgi:dTDP-4-amino-4,6-dideoxygalactose transaminase
LTGLANSLIPLAKPSFSKLEVEAVRKVLESGWVSQGPITRRFEDAFGKYIGSGYAVSTNSCTSALHVALLAAGVGKGDKVIVPDFTFPATANAVLYAGAKPIIIDVDQESMAIDPNFVKEHISDGVKAIIPVHPFGDAADLNSLRKVAEDNSCQVIEDAATAIGTMINGRKIGATGNLCCFSFHGRKVISTGEGGMVTTDDRMQAERVRSLISHGQSIQAWQRGRRMFVLPEFKTLGFNYRMSDIQAAIGLTQLKKVERFIKKRRVLADLYAKMIADRNLPVRTPEERINVRHVYQSYVIALEGRLPRNGVISKLRACGIECTIGTYSLSNLPLFRKEWSGKCPVGDQLFRNTIALPLYTEMTSEHVKRIVDALAEILRKFR